MPVRLRERRMGARQSEIAKAKDELTALEAEGATA